MYIFSNPGGGKSPTMRSVDLADDGVGDARDGFLWGRSSGQTRLLYYTEILGQTLPYS